MRKEQKQEWDTTLCEFPIYHSMTLPTVIHNACREGRGGVIYREYTECCIPFMFLFFFHQSCPKYLQNVFIYYKCVYIRMYTLHNTASSAPQHVRRGAGDAQPDPARPNAALLYGPAGSYCGCRLCSIPDT